MIDALHIVSTRALLRALHRRPAEMGLLSALTEHPGRPTSVKELGDIIYGSTIENVRHKATVPLFVVRASPK